MESAALGVGQLIKPLLVTFPSQRHSPVHATAVARTLVRSAATAREGVTIIESGSALPSPAAVEAES